VLVLRPGALGDTLLAVPALRALRRAYTPLRLGAHAATARLLASLGEVDEGLGFDDPSLSWLFREPAVPGDEPVVAWMNPLSAAPALRHALLVAPSRPPEDERHCASYLLESLAPLGIDLAWDDAPLNVEPLRSEDVLIHVGSGSPAKNWPPARFASAIRELDAAVRLIVGEADAAASSAVEKLLGRALPRLSQPSLEELARRLAGCRAYLGNDSGVSHLAGLCGARTVALFGPTNPRVWRPLGPDVHVMPFEAPTASVVARVTGG
jgi:heptosyltransferase III